ncbi:MAG TPA: hypothetical protein VFD49_01840 [Candidatus Dormibacteraeota bacterium]|nr:hypothetical protein [Candidatus Dormibacteraeota bacterium]
MRVMPEPWRPPRGREADAPRSVRRERGQAEVAYFVGESMERQPLVRELALGACAP